MKHFQTKAIFGVELQYLYLQKYQAIIGKWCLKFSLLQ